MYPPFHHSICLFQAQRQRNIVHVSFIPTLNNDAGPSRTAQHQPRDHLGSELSTSSGIQRLPSIMNSLYSFNVQDKQPEEDDWYESEN